MTIRKCPDCGKHPDIKENYMAAGGHLVSGVMCEQCDLVAFHFTTQSGIDLWNRMCEDWEKNGGTE